MTDNTCLSPCVPLHTGATTSLAVVSVSGGKDSTATALLALETHGQQRCRFVFADPGNEHDITLNHIHTYLSTVLGPIDTVRADFSKDIARKRVYVETIWPQKRVPDEIIRSALSVLHPTGIPFLDLCLWKGRFPSRKAQFCTQMLKRIPLDGYLLERMAEGWRVESWRGIRRDESTNRKDAPDRELVAEGFEIVQPIAAWTAQQTVDYVMGKGVRLNPLYSKGMGRVGCMPCINCSKDELLEIAKRYPEHIDKIREWERLVSLAAKRGYTTFFADAASTSPVPKTGWIYEKMIDDDGNEITQWVEPPAEVCDRLRIDNRIRWAQTARGGKQLDFIRMEAPLPCSSQYGLCE